MSFEPLTGCRKATITDRRRKQEFAHMMRRLAEEAHPEAEKIRLVLDNLSTHSGAAFYEGFSTEEHGYWLERSSSATHRYIAHG
jgi:hypothetical protein